MRTYSLLGRLLASSSLPLLAALTPLPALALEGSTFEGKDGNMTVTTSGLRDWESFKGSVSIGKDKASGSGDDALGQGSKDDDPTPTTVTGSIPNNKDDLKRFYVQSESVNGKSFLYMAWTRVSTLGSANMSIELNQLVQPAPPASGPWAMRRTAGDLLILFDFPGSGSPVLSVSKWIAKGLVASSECQASNKFPCWGKVAALGTVNAEGAVNSGDVPDPLNNNAKLTAKSFGEMAINLTDAKLLTTYCQGFGSAMLRSRSSNSFNSELKDFIAPQLIAIARAADPTDAEASGTALGASVKIGSTAPINLPQPPGLNPSISGGVSGPGEDSQSAGQLQINVPTADFTLNKVTYKAGDVLKASAINTTTISKVDVSGAYQTTTSEILGLNVLKGLVTADVVSSVANTFANDRASGLSTVGTGIKGLKVAGVAINSVQPNAKVTLNESQFGKGSFVSLYEVGPNKTLRTGTTSQPALKQLGPYKADATVTMLQIHIADDNGKGLLGLPNGGNVLDIVIALATAHSEFIGVACTNQEVGAQAVIVDANVKVLGTQATAAFGHVAIPRSGGEQLAAIDALRIGGAGPGILELGVAKSRATGIVIPFAISESSSEASVATACVLPTVGGGCTIFLDVLKAAAHAKASPSGATADPADTAVVATIGNLKINAPPNTTIPLPGLGYVTLNEQTCDNLAPLASGCADGKQAGIMVRAVHVVVNVPLNQLGLDTGVEVVVGQARADASYAE